MPVRISKFLLKTLCCAVLLQGVCSFASEPVTETPVKSESAEENSQKTSAWNLGELADRVPEFIADRLPLFQPPGALRIYVRPHFGDILHAGYARVPVGARVKFTDRIEGNAELQTYFAHGSSEASGSGLSALNLGVKCEHLLSTLDDGGYSLGLDYRMPFNGSPREFTDGYRHLQPFVGVTEMIVPAWRLIGYSSLGANFLEHTALPSNFGRNQLHANSLALTGGIVREWGRLRVSFTARMASTEFMSDEGRQNFSLRPEVIIPLRTNPRARTQLFLTLAARVLWGPEGFETDTSTSFRVTLRLDRSPTSKKLRVDTLSP